MFSVYRPILECSNTGSSVISPIITNAPDDSLAYIKSSASRVPSYVPVYGHVCVCTCTHTYIVYAYVDACVPVYGHVCVCTCTHAYIVSSTCTVPSKVPVLA